jgi:hypothetical protein
MGDQTTPLLEKFASQIERLLQRHGEAMVADRQAIVQDATPSVRWSRPRSRRLSFRRSAVR